MLSNLTQRAMIEAQTLVPDGGGGYTTSWTTLATVWAAVEPIGGADVFGPDANESRVRYRITLRRRTDVTAGMRVRVNARTFAIHAVLDDGARAQFITLLTEVIA